MNIRQPEVATLIAVRQPFVVETHAVQNRRIEIVNMDRILHNVVTVVIRLTERHARLDPATSQPH